MSYPAKFDRAKPMAPLSRALFRTLSKIAIAVVLAVALWFPAVAAQASIHTYPLENGPQTGSMVRSLQTLRDNRDRSWQVVMFFNVLHNQVTNVHLRLAGFPGTVVDRSKPLVVTQGAQTWELSDVFDLTNRTASEVGNIGEYDAAEMMRSLERSRPMTLTLSLAAGDIDITLPPFAVKEWLKLRTQATLPNTLS